ncbi:hypothetical protein DFH06DRAFT_1323402 [Mycena polygramma]|nr:hypothetical protein DFH06DRAFT_1323402 [Mycena polygramma]
MALNSYGPAELAHGPMFIGFLFNVILYGESRIMITQTYIYFSTFGSDRARTKIFVACILVLDTLNTFFDFAYLYDSLIIHFGDVPFLAEATWLFATDPIMTALIAFLVQGFYAWRVKVLTGNVWLALFVAACSLTGLAGGIATTVEVCLVPHFSDFIHFKSTVIVWLAAECMADVLITIILVTMQTGLITSLCASIDLILFLTDPIGLHLIFNVPLCKLYTNSLLSSLNARRVRGAPGSADSGQTGLMVSKRLSAPPPPQFRSSILIDVESVCVSDVSGAPVREVV